jgi:hypothetical protein
MTPSPHHLNTINGKVKETKRKPCILLPKVINPKPLLEAQTPNTKLDKYNSCSNNPNHKPKKISLNATAANPKLQNPKLEKMQQLHIHTYKHRYIYTYLMPISAGLTGKNPNTKSVSPASCNKTAIKEIAATLSQTPPAIISFPCCSNTKNTHIHKPTSEIEWVVPKRHQP